MFNFSSRRSLESLAEIGGGLMASSSSLRILELNFSSCVAGITIVAALQWGLPKGTIGLYGPQSTHLEQVLINVLEKGAPHP